MFGRTLNTRPAGGLATAPTTLFLSYNSREELKNARLPENGSPELWLQGRPNSPQDFEFAGQDDPQPQTPPTGSPVLGLSTNDLGIFFPTKPGEENSLTYTPHTIFSASTSTNLGTPLPGSISMSPTSTFASDPSSPHSCDQHPDLLAVNQRIAELEALAEPIEQEHNDYVKNAREMEATLMALEEEVVSEVDAIKAVNKKTSLEAKENLNFSIGISRQIHYRKITEDFVEDAKRTSEAGQKKYAELQARFESLQRERQQQGIYLANAVPPFESSGWRCRRSRTRPGPSLAQRLLIIAYTLSTVKREYERGQKKYAQLQARFENLPH
ncbi:hypothetical protein FS837_005193 [Tulasnella sp. UAMH 9824]|nr:hypothetical protein FS837_005193 [Tulasnella sp. UAMH 9824]